MAGPGSAFPIPAHLQTGSAQNKYLTIAEINNKIDSAILCSFQKIPKNRNTMKTKPYETLRSS